MSYKKEYHKHYYTINKEKVQQRNQKYYNKNKLKILKQQKEYYKNNKEKSLKSSRQWKEKNKIKLKENRLKNKEKIAKLNKKYYQKNKEILNKQSLEYYYKNKEKISKRQKEYYQNPKNRYLQAQKAAKRRNLFWNISYNDYVLLIKNPCYYNNTHQMPKTGISLDRIDNNKGYILTNVLPCCSICNQGRSNNYTVEEWKAMIETLENIRKSKVS